MKVALVDTRWNHFIVNRLVEGAQLAFVPHGAHTDNLDLVTVPGSFEYSGL